MDFTSEFAFPERANARVEAEMGAFREDFGNYMDYTDGTEEDLDAIDEDVEDSDHDSSEFVDVDLKDIDEDPEGIYHGHVGAENLNETVMDNALYLESRISDVEDGLHYTEMSIKEIRHRADEHTREMHGRLEDMRMEGIMNDQLMDQVRDNFKTARHDLNDVVSRVNTIVENARSAGERIADVDTRVRQLDDRLEEVVAGHRVVGHMMIAGDFSTGLENRLDGVAHRVGGLETHISDLDASLRNTEMSVEENRRQAHVLSHRLGNLEEQHEFDIRLTHDRLDMVRDHAINVSYRISDVSDLLCSMIGGQANVNHITREDINGLTTRIDKEIERTDDIADDIADSVNKLADKTGRRHRAYKSRIRNLERVVKQLVSYLLSLANHQTVG